MKKIFIFLLILITTNYCVGQSSIVFKTETNLIVVSYKSNSEFDLKNPIYWNGRLQTKNNNYILIGAAVSSVSSDVGYLFGVLEVNYNTRVHTIADQLDKREFIRIYKLTANKKDYLRNDEQLYILSSTSYHVKKPVEKSLLELTLKKPNKTEIIEKDSIMEDYILSQERRTIMFEKYIYEREQKGYELYFKYENNLDELKLRNVVDSIFLDFKSPFECELKFEINSNGDYIRMYVSESNQIYSYLFNSTKFEKKINEINEYIKRNKLKTKPIILHDRNFYSYCEFYYKHRFINKSKK